MDEPESKRVRPDRRLRLRSRETTFSSSSPLTWMTLRSKRLFLPPVQFRTPSGELKQNESCLSIVKVMLNGCSVPRQCRLLATVMFIMLAAPLAFLAFPRSARAQGPPHGKERFDKRCGGCHSLDNDKEGPRLRAV